MIQLDEIIDPQISKYHADLQALTKRALNGEINEREFIQEAEKLVIAAFAVAFILGGGAPNEAANATAEKQAQTLRSVRLLAKDIYDGRYSLREDENPQTVEEGAEKLNNRLLLWLVTLAGIYQIGKIFGDQQRRYRWKIGGTEKHCRDCLRNDGRVMTAAEWRRFGQLPQSGNLECGGFYCDCDLVRE